MKVLVDSDILYDIILDNDNCSESLNMINNFELNKIVAYVSALDIIEICHDIDNDIAIKINRILDKVFKIIELKTYDIKKGLASGNLCRGIVSYQAKRTKVDCIICRDKSKYINSKIEAIYPNELGDYVKRWKQN